MNANFTLKLLCQIVLLLISTIGAEAASLSAEQALQRVESYGPKFRAPGNVRYTLEYSEKVAEENILYVFNNGVNGFIIASGDDRMPPLLGYSDSGPFDLDNISPEFKWWLSQYAAEASELFKSNVSQDLVYSGTRSNRETIPVLLNTKWDQADPYNLYCPYDGSRRSVTGCVATAMAQVIKYHGYPSKGKGSHTYEWKGNTLSYNFSDATFDYENMLDIYDNSASQTQKETVANLMYACGVSVDMNYSYNGSSAYEYKIADALKAYFDYDSGISYRMRNYYSDKEWIEIVYSELQAGRPVIYGGGSSEGAHEFVCDGFDNGYFHFNWGWGGNYDGWFLLSALNPYGHGIGGYEGGYNYNQGITCGVQPNVGNLPTEYPIYATESIDRWEIVENSWVTLSFSDGNGMYNYSSNEIETSFYLQAVSSAGEQYLSTPGVTRNFPSFQGYSAISIYLPTVPASDYKTFVIYEGPEGEIQRLRFPKTCKDYLYMTVDEDRNYSFYQGPDISVTDIAVTSDVFSGKYADFTFTMNNNGDRDYSGPLYMRLIDPVTFDVITEKHVEVSVNQGESTIGSFSITCDMPAGAYALLCYDMYDNICCERFDFEVNDPIPSILNAALLNMGDIFSSTPASYIIGLENIGDIDYEGDLHVKVFDSISGEFEKDYIVFDKFSLKSKDLVYYLISLDFDLPAGEYSLQCYDMYDLACSALFPLTILDNSNIPDLHVSEMTPLSELYTEETSEVSMKLQNEGTYEYNGALSVYVFEHATDSCIGIYAVDIPKVAAGDSLEITTKLNFDLTVGEYDIVVYDMFNKPCSNVFQMQIKNRIPEPTSEILKTNLISWGEIYTSTPACFSLKYNNIGASAYSGELTIKAFNAYGELIDDNVYSYYHYYNEPLPPGDTYSWFIKLVFDLPVGEYLLQCYDVNDNPCSDVLPIEIKDNCILPELQITDLSAFYKVCTGEFSRFSVSLKNNGTTDYNGGFGIELYTQESDSCIVIKHYLGYKLTPGEEITDWCWLTFDSLTEDALPIGKYDLRCIDMFGNPCSDVFTIDIVNREDLPESEILKVELEPISDIYSQLRSYFNISVVNSGKDDYDGCWYIRIYDASSGKKNYEYPMNDINLLAEASRNWLDVLFFDLPAGMYNFQCYDKDGYPCSEIQQLEIKDNSVLPEVEVTEVSSDSGLFIGETQQITITLKNVGDIDYFGVIYTDIYDAKTDEWKNGYITWDIRVTPEEEYEYSLNLLNELPVGEYKLLFYDMFINPCGGFPLIVRNRDEISESVTAPTIDFAEGTVTITCETLGAEIHYTLDGSTPTAASDLYEAPFALERNATVKAIAIIPDLDINPSEVAELVVDSYKVAIPTGIFDASTRQLTLSCTTEGALISYTFEKDGEWTSYTAPISITRNCTIYARATFDGYNDSDVAEIAVTTLPDKVSVPTINFKDGTVTISCEMAEAEIRYTLDGKVPTATSTLYEVPFTLNRNAVVKAIAIIPDLDVDASEVAELVVDSYKVATPVGVFDASTRQLTLSCTTEGALISYTLEKEGEWTSYTSPISIKHNCTVYARATFEGYNDSDVAEISVNALPDKVSVPTISFKDGTVTISSETEGAEIHYTLDGTVPTPTSTLYETPFALNRNAVVRAISIIPDLDIDPSEVAELVVDSYKVATPVGVFDASTRQLTLSCATEGAFISYTFEKEGEWTSYTAPISITRNRTVYARATFEGYNDSDVAEIAVNALPDKVSVPTINFNDGTVTISCETV